MFKFFSKKAEKEDVDKIKVAVQTGFNRVKHDMDSYSQWIKHINKNNFILNEEIIDIKDELSNIKNEAENIKNMLDIIANKKNFKQTSTLFNKQPSIVDVLNTNQTTVQTTFLENLTPNERVIIFVLINSDLKLSYEDLAAMLGKKRSTIRGQVNSIRQKSEELIKEIIGENNKKRIFIPEKTKELLLKIRKVRDKNNK